MEKYESFEEFRSRLLNKPNPQFKVRNSWGVYDGYKYYRKNKPKESKYVLTESQYFAIIRRVNQILGDALALGEDITFPHHMGRLEIRKYIPKIKLKENGVKTSFPVDWNKTLRLWYEDKEAYKNKTLVKVQKKEIFRIYYNRGVADYTNKTFYEFIPHVPFLEKFYKNVDEDLIDAFLLKRRLKYE